MQLQQKNIFLLVGIILLLWLSYIFSFSKAFDARSKYMELMKEKDILKKIPTQILTLKQENVFLDSLLSKQLFSSESSFQNNLLQYISKFSEDNNIQIVSFNTPHVFSKEGSGTLKTFSFSVKGNYTAITELIYNLEQKNKFGKIISVAFEKKKNFRTNKNYLVCSMLLQRVEK